MERLFDVRIDIDATRRWIKTIARYEIDAAGWLKLIRQGKTIAIFAPGKWESLVPIQPED